MAIVPKEAAHSLRKTLGEEGEQLSPQEAVGLLDARRSSVERVRDLIARMPTTKALTVLARMGEKHKTWYQDAKKDLEKAFGTEAPRFIALLAATSANKGIKDNFRIAAYIWGKYKELQTKGPVDRASLLKMVQQVNDQATINPNLNWLRYSTGEGYADQINLVRALNPEEDAGNAFDKILGGPTTHKIDSFRKNLLGNLMAVTNDVWVAKIMGIQNKGKRGEEAGFQAPKGHEYTAYSLKIKDVAKKLGWTPAETQAAMWQAMRQIALNYVRGQQRHSRKLAWQEAGHPPVPLQATTAEGAAAGVTEEHITGGGSFSNLLNHPDVKKYLPKQALKHLQGKPPAQVPKVPSPSVYRQLSHEDKEAVQPVIKQIEGGSSKGWGFQPTTIWEAKKHGPRRRYAEGEAPRTDGSITPPPTPNQAGQVQAVQQGPPAAGGVMVSPNTEQGLSFAQANERRGSANHKSLQKIIKGFADRLGVKAKLHSAVGAWKDGAEDSIYQELDHPQNPETVRYLGALYGQYANQKQVLIFHHNPAGKDALYQLELPGHVPLDEIHKLCLRLGLDYQTIVPQKDKTRLVLYDEGRALRSKVAELGSQLHAVVSESPVTGESLGDSSGSDPAKARAAYRKIIDSYEAKHPTPANTGSLQEKQQAILGNHGGAGVPGQQPQAGAGVKKFHKLRSWIAPNGEIHEVPEDLTHDQWAAQSLGKNPHSLGNRKHAERLLKQGWGRVTRYGKQLFYNNQWQAPSNNQTTILKDLAQEHGLTDVLHDREDPEAEPRTLWSTKDQMAHKGPRKRFSGVQSPQGGVVVRGLFYPGGKYIPQAELEKSNYQQYEQVGKRRRELEKAKLSKTRRGDGSVPDDLKIKYALGEHLEQAVDDFTEGDPGVEEAGDWLKEAGRSVGAGLKEIGKKALSHIKKAYDKAPLIQPEKKQFARRRDGSLHYSAQGDPPQEKIQQTPSLKKIPQVETDEQLLESGGLPRPHTQTTRIDQMGREVPLPTLEHKRKKGYREQEPLPEVPFEEAGETKAPTPVDPGRGALGPQGKGVWGIYQDFYDEHNGEFKTLEEKQQAGSILLHAMVDDGPFQATPGLYKHAYESLYRGGPRDPRSVEPPKPTPEQAQALYESWLVADRMRDYIHQHSAAGYDKAYETWAHKANILNSLIHRFHIIPDLHRHKQSKQVRAVQHALIMLNAVRRENRAPYIQTLREAGLPV